MTDIVSILDVPVAGKTILVRADLNVPVVEGVVGDRTRIVRFADTAAELARRGAKVIVISHLGRPNGNDGNLSLRPVAHALTEALGHDVTFISDCVGDVVEHSIQRLQYGRVALLENLRFHAEEEANSRLFALRLCVMGEIYVNDAFSCSHRAHASTHAITEILPSYAGPSLLAEVKALESVLARPERPVGALIGGAKVSSKIAILEQLVKRMDVVIVGGGMANTFLMAQGKNVGSSLCEPNQVLTAAHIINVARQHSCQIVLPSDVTIAREFKGGAAASVTSVEDVPDDSMILDIGPDSIEGLKVTIDGLSTLLWNGPLGAFELEPFDKGTNAVAQHVASRTSAGILTSVAGGGDTAAALNAAGVADQFTYLSTAGGAFLEWLEGRELPGIQALKSSKLKSREA